jgi:probable rRNA maturation factor|tara:strand:+ start:3504 stop:3947 length:444 start_codon:yes stop_codon:yes gene_type:complete
MKNINVFTDPKYDEPSKKLCISIIKSIFTHHSIYIYDINIVFTSDVHVSDLKKQFFSKDQWTDVIAFPLSTDYKGSIEGEIYISIPTAKENADLFNQRFGQELTRLIVHGALHLLGYEDDTIEKKKKMIKKEDFFLKDILWRKLFEK